VSDPAGWIVVLNGAPRSGKSSIARVVQDTFDGVWMNLGVDVFARHVTPARYRPGMGLRPGGERPEIEALIPAFFAAFYDSVAAHSRHGLNVVVDVGHHDGFSSPRGVLHDAARRLSGLPAVLVGVRCPDEVIAERRSRDETGSYSLAPDRIRRWQEEVHRPGVYDLEVDTSVMSPEQCAEAVRVRMSGPPLTALAVLASAME